MINTFGFCVQEIQSVERRVSRPDDAELSQSTNRRLHLQKQEGVVNGCKRVPEIVKTPQNSYHTPINAVINFLYLIRTIAPSHPPDANYAPVTGPTEGGRGERKSSRPVTNDAGCGWFMLSSRREDWVQTGASSILLQIRITTNHLVIQREPIWSHTRGMFFQLFLLLSNISVLIQFI